MTVGEQLQLELDRRCPGCGSARHHGCGYDPEMVKPAMSVADALSATLQHSLELHGFEGMRERHPGLRYWNELTEAERDEYMYGPAKPKPKRRRKA
jgi:hypothetical protein